jgi:hypothetical protein
MALLAADQVTAERNSGAIRFFGNRYWCDGLARVAGERVTVRFDPDALHGEVHVYAADGSFVATAPAIEASGFLDQAAAKTRAKQEAEHRRVTRRAIELEALLTPAQVAAMLPGYEDEAGETPSSGVIRPVRVNSHGRAAAALAQPTPRRAPLIDKLNLEEIAPRRLRLVD